MPDKRAVKNLPKRKAGMINCMSYLFAEKVLPIDGSIGKRNEYLMYNVTRLISKVIEVKYFVNVFILGSSLYF